jgi:imidazolonepropionase-like amidohydrolase
MSDSLTLRGGSVIIGTGEVLPRADVLIEGGRIARVSTSGSAPRADDIIDVSGLWLHPGFIDAHVHLVGGDPVPIDDERKSFRIDEPAAMAALRGVRAGITTVSAGVTTVRETQARECVDVSLRDAIRDGVVDGPRMLSCGAGIARTGGHGAFITDVGDGVEEVRKLVYRQIELGVDWIKIASVDGPQFTGSWSSVQYTLEEVRAIADAAHLAGRHCAAHAVGAEAVRICVEAGIDTVEHAWFLDEETCQMLASTDTPIVPTLWCLCCLLDNAVSTGIGSWLFDLDAHSKDVARSSFLMAREMGVSIVMGSDCGGNASTRHGTNAMELVTYVEFGMTPEEALATTSREAARVLRLEDLGTLETGKEADIVVLRGNPLEDIRHVVDGVAMVVKGGLVKVDKRESGS